MYCYQLVCTLIIVVVTSSHNLVNADDPPIPVWPNIFQEGFEEISTLPVIGTGKLTGTYYYDFEHKMVRIDRTTGKYDRYCSSIEYFEDTPCNHRVVDGLRYLEFPAKNYCCMCCTSEKGCGIVRPDWLVNATFIGYNTTDSVKYQVWDKRGLQENYYWEVDTTHVPYIIDQQPNDKMTFNVSTFSTTVDPSVFALPSYCSKDHKCPLISVCTEA